MGKPPVTEAVISFMKDRGINKKHEAGALVVTAQIARQILVIRSQKVMLDADTIPRRGVIAIDRNLETDLRTVFEIPSSIAQCRVDEDVAGLALVER